MTPLARAAPAFVEMAHRIVWATVATVDRQDRPRSRVLHPFWQWDGDALVGWIATMPTATKLAHLERSPFVSVGYWAPNHDTCVAECEATWFLDDDTCERIWELFKHAPAPVGYDPAIIPEWADGPRGANFAALRLEPWHLRVFPGKSLMVGLEDVLTWNA